MSRQNETMKSVHCVPENVDACRQHHCFRRNPPGGASVVLGPGSPSMGQVRLQRSIIDWNKQFIDTLVMSKIPVKHIVPSSPLSEGGSVCVACPLSFSSDLS